VSGPPSFVSEQLTSRMITKGEDSNSMGLTIHWSLRSNTRSPKQARETIAHLRGRALDLPFEAAVP